MIIKTYRKLRVFFYQLLGREPMVFVKTQIAVEFYGNDYCGWAIPSGQLCENSVVVDVGLGEDISFSQALIEKIGCDVHGFDPTPKAIQHIKQLANSKLVMHEYGVSAKAGLAMFYLPNNDSHVSGTLHKDAAHAGLRAIEVSLLTLGDVFVAIKSERINLLKIDIEGSEFDLIADEKFKIYAKQIDCLCVEFHHRWPTFGKGATLKAVQKLNELGFECVWRNKSTNEEFTFVNFNNRK